MKQHTKTTCPNNLLFFDTETKAKRKDKKLEAEYHYLWFGFANAFRLEQGERTREVWTRFETTEQFWEFVDSRIEKERPLYCFAHNLGFDITICDFWNKCQQEDWYIDFFVLDDPPTMIGVTTPKGKIYFVDTLNYWRSSLKVLGDSLGFPKGEMPGKKASKKLWDKYCKQDVEILAQSVVNLITYLRTNELGSFGLTAPTMAMNTYKRRFMQSQIYIHDRYNVCELEREAYYGGRVECFFVGNVRNTKLFNYDVNSLYPFVMLNEFPIKLKADVKDISVSTALHLMEEYSAVAHVTLTTDTTTYPKRVDKKLCMVRGHFQTHLCGPELYHALSAGHVQRIHHFAWYHKGRLFDNYVKHFWDARKRYKAEGNVVYDLFCKLMMNSLYGKFAQRGYQWKDYSKRTLISLYEHFGIPFPKQYEKRDIEPSIEFGSMKLTLLGFKFPIPFRRLHNKVQMCFPLSEHHESFPLISAYVTSYGRIYLQTLIETAGQGNVYYCDTDSLFVNKEGQRRLKNGNFIQPDKLGGLKLAGESTNTTFYCPKDYIFDGAETRKGIRKDAIDMGNGSFKMVQFEGIKSILNRTPDPFIRIHMQTKRNRRKYTKGTVQPNGWTVPFDFSQNEQVILF